MRMSKIKSRVSLVRSVQHNTRERMPPNADKAKSAENLHVGGSVSDVMTHYSDLLPEKVRKNAVHAVELMFTASPDFRGDWQKYLEKSQKWAENLFGKENVLSVAVHRDELTPHAHMIVMPLKDGKLNAKHFIGGSRDRMTELQNDFYAGVGTVFDLQRGQSRAETHAAHTQHSLAIKTAEVAAYEQKLRAESAKFTEIMQMKPSEVKKLKEQTEKWDKATPQDLKNLATVVESKGFSNLGEYRQANALQRQKQLENKGFSR
ncbi:MAG: hypothetical protein Ta2A_19450 [Treponemataceae bacterium]|nr:MAG: hypothetical protein Ta2A_19450 [Treponemataceae bacterium]